MKSTVIIVNNFKVAKKLDLICSQHRKEKIIM